MTLLQEYGGQSLCEEIVVRRVQIPRGIRTQDFEFPGCCDGTCSSTTKVLADLNTSIPVTGLILT